ncbi:MAG: hypothetical protein HY719_11940 [Planctomycetes bacterium]|nr:hypothetical protein [Planctomycetota bacterium]
MTDKPRVYVDSAPIIDLVKDRVDARTPREQAKNAKYMDLLIRAAWEKEIDLFTSTLAIAECTHVRDPAKEGDAKPFFMGLLASGKGGFALVQTTTCGSASLKTRVSCQRSF